MSLDLTMALRAMSQNRGTGLSTAVRSSDRPAAARGWLTSLGHEHTAARVDPEPEL
jgi:hypothetical protein